MNNLDFNIENSVIYDKNLKPYRKVSFYIPVNNTNLSNEEFANQFLNKTYNEES